MKDLKIIYGKIDDIPKDSFEKALDLRYRIYSEEGFIKEGKKSDLDRYDSKAVHFLAITKNRVVGYLRLLEDMPLLSLYSNEVNEVRKLKRFNRPIEFSRFVAEKEGRIGVLGDYSMFVSMLLLREAYSYIVRNNFDSVFAVVNPRHLRRYKKFYYFEQFGEQKNYGVVADNPALLLFQNVKEAVSKAEKFNKALHDFMLH